MLTFTGTHECTLDSKGRIQLPVSLRRQLTGDGSNEFVLRISIFSKCLELYPKSEWNLELEKINQLNRYQSENLDFIRLFMAGSKTVEMDATGRILITKDLLNYAGIKKDVVVASRLNVLEIWDKEAYENTIGSVTPEAFAELARKVMGNTPH